MMSNKKTNTILEKISECKKKGFFIEALVLSYHFNLELLFQLSKKTLPELETDIKKPKHLVKELLKHSSNGTKKPVLSKQSLKSIKTWSEDMEAVFKKLRSEIPQNNKALLQASEQVSALLSIAANKVSS
jgi:hypothetical protein